MIYTYFVSNSVNSLIKIGRTKNIENRKKQIRGQLNFVKIETELLIEGDYERPLHNYYRRKRLHGGEWFDIVVELTEEQIHTISEDYYNRVQRVTGLTRKDILGIERKSSPITEEYSYLRYNNLDEFAGDDLYTVNWEGHNYIICKTPRNRRKISAEEVYNTLEEYATNLKYLNLDLEKEYLENILQYFNSVYFNNPITEDAVATLVCNIFAKNEAGRLYPILAKKKRKIIFDHDNKSKLSVKDKLEICRDLVSKKKQRDSKERLQSIIDEWDTQLQGKITARALVKFAKMGNNTVNKYYKEFKDIVEAKNKSGAI